MQIGCAASAESIEALKELGYDFIELSGRYLTALEDKDFFTLQERLSEAGLPCLAANAYCPPQVVIAGPDFKRNKAESYAEKFARRAALLGIRNVSIGSPFSRNLPQGFNRKTAMEQADVFFDITASVLEKYGMTTCVEALGFCYCNFINHLEDAVQILERVQKSSLKIVLDFYNMEQSGEGNLDFSGCIRQVRHVHISDDDGNPTRRYFLKDEKFEIHKKRLLRLKDSGYDGPLCVEIDLPVDRAKAGQTLRFIKECIRQN